MPISHVFVVVGQSDIRRENRLFASRLSRSLKVTGTTNTDQSATRHFLLVIRSNHWLTSYPFQEKRRFRSKLADFYPTPVFTSKRFPLEFCNGYRAQKIGWCIRQIVEKFDMSIRLDTIPQCEGQKL